jgi:hypothetical protein
MTAAETRAALGIDAKGLAETEEVHGGARSGGVTIERLTFEAFRHLGQNGVLTLTYYIDSLVMAIFRPADIDQYLCALRSAYDNDFERSREIRVPRSTTVWVTTNQQQGTFAGWRDHALAERYDIYSGR